MGPGCIEAYPPQSAGTERNTHAAAWLRLSFVGRRGTNQDIYDALVLGATSPRASMASARAVRSLGIERQNPESNADHVAAEMVVERTAIWVRTIAGLMQRLRAAGLAEIGRQFTLVMTTYNLIRLPRLLATGP